MVVALDCNFLDFDEIISKEHNSENERRNPFWHCKYKNGKHYQIRNRIIVESIDGTLNKKQAFVLGWGMYPLKIEELWDFYKRTS